MCIRHIFTQMIKLGSKKEVIRKKILSSRRKLTDDGVERLSRKICKKFLGLEQLTKAHNISIYLSINNEVKTKSIIDVLMQDGKEIFLPTAVILRPEAEESKLRSFAIAQDDEYMLVKFSGWKDLEAGPHGILQPTGTTTVDPQSIDVAVIPGVAFDKRGVRLGYGKGVFDRLFSKSKAFKIGLAYDFQIVEELPKEEHDLVMDLVVTEKRIVKFT